MREWGEMLARVLPSGSVEERSLLREKTTLRIGGPVRCCVTARRGEDLVKAVKICREAGAPWFLLGGGSNVLFSDRGFDGVLIVAQTEEVAPLPGNILEVAAGVPLMELVRLAEARGLSGLENLAGIPGSVGGAIVGNAGAYGQSIAERLESVELITEGGEVVWVPPDSLEFDYRESRLKRSLEVVLSARFRLAGGDRESISRIIRETLATRAEKHPPHDTATAGSFFKNLPPESPGGRRIAAGLILDRAGARGMRVGEACVFEKHANIVVNQGHARAADVLELTRAMKQLAFDHAGVILEEEVRRIGFTHEELSRCAVRAAATV